VASPRSARSTLVAVVRAEDFHSVVGIIISEASALQGAWVVGTLPALLVWEQDPEGACTVLGVSVLMACSWS
jgi:hypothetical protein